MHVPERVCWRLLAASSGKTEVEIATDHKVSGDVVAMDPAGAGVSLGSHDAIDLCPKTVRNPVTRTSDPGVSRRRP